MKILVDTNIVIDYITIREPFYEAAYKIVKLCADKQIKGVMAVHSIPNVYYLLRKQMTEQQRRNVIKSMLKVFDVALFDKDMVFDALDKEDFKDFEDCLQDECADSCGADYIVTRNIRDFENSKVQAITPDEFLKKIDNQ
ncbi:MAG: PIN domain-containing protein [Clostridia bacterium]|nr:PIN domain-containing protein [Clostridia bacterium]MBR2175394.1 PIN domain-containing protein [Clostridia bacterium]